jgi:hypothetical protein
MDHKFLTAIVYTNDGQFLKYRNIRNYSYQNNLFYNPKFLTFVENKNGKTINLYDKFTKEFFKQIKLKNENT